MKNILFVNIILFVIVISFSSKPVLAAEELENAIKGADSFVNMGKEKIEDEKMQGFSNSLVNIFITAGVVVAVIYTSILGMKYMMGSLEEKAEIKETLIPFVVGCIVIFGAFTIWKIVINIGSNI